MREQEELELELIEYLQANGLLVYIYDMEKRKLISTPLPDCWFSEHPLHQVVHLTRTLFNLLDKYDQEKNMIENMRNVILFSGNHIKRLEDTKSALQRYENFVQTIGFLLYGHGHAIDAPNYYTGKNLSKEAGDACIKNTKIEILVKGEIGKINNTIPLPSVNGHRPFVAEGDQLQKRLLETIRLFRDIAMHGKAIDFNYYELYNLGGICSEPIRRNLALSSLHIIDYHYHELESHIL